MNQNDFAYFINSLCLLLAIVPRKAVRAVKSLAGVGIVVIIFGIVFFLQGHSVVGPKSSFMYSNPQWIINGQWIIIVGIIILIVGLLTSKLIHNSQSHS